MRDAEWTVHERNEHHYDRVDIAIPTGWICNEERCPAKSSSLKDNSAQRLLNREFDRG